METTPPENLNSPANAERPQSWRGLRFYIAVVVALGLTRLTLGLFVRVPPNVAWVLEVLLAVVFVGLPIYALFRAAAAPWEKRHAGIMVALGVLLHAGFALLNYSLSVPPNPEAGPTAYAQSAWPLLVTTVAQSGLLIWTLGLGALLATSLKDKNLLLPIAAFLAGFDIFLIFNPTAITHRLVTENPELTQAVNLATPTVAVVGQQQVPIAPFAIAGAADLFFLGMFFVALYRFGMRAAETMRWVVPILIIYLLVVLAAGGGLLPPILGMLPALVPIGITVLIINRKEFKLNKEELAGTWGVVVIALLLAGYGIYRAATFEPLGPPDAVPNAVPYENGSGINQPDTMPDP